jgi:lysophospholipase L1-like esterase
VGSFFILNFDGMFKKLIVNILIVLAVVFVLDFGIGRLLRYFYFKETSGLHYRSTYSMDSTMAEVLVFGASRANHHYVPQVFEDSLHMTFYNTGRDGNGIFYEYALLKSILKRYTPKVIILENPGQFFKIQNEFDKITSLLPYYRTNKEIRQNILDESPYENIKLVSEIYPFNSQVLTILIGNLEINKKRVHDIKGYVPLDNEWQLELDSTENGYIYEKDANKINAFRKFISTARDLGIRVFIVSSPVFQKFNINRGIEVGKEICTEEKIPFFDFSRDSFFLTNRSFFQDIIHLNNKGATEFSKIVANKILQSKK